MNRIAIRIKPEKLRNGEQEVIITPHSAIWVLTTEGKIGFIKPHEVNPVKIESDPTVSAWWVDTKLTKTELLLSLCKASNLGADKQSVERVANGYNVDTEMCLRFCDQMQIAVAKDEGVFHMTFSSVDHPGKQFTHESDSLLWAVIGLLQQIAKYPEA